MKLHIITLFIIIFTTVKSIEEKSYIQIESFKDNDCESQISTTKYKAIKGKC